MQIVLCNSARYIYILCVYIYDMYQALCAVPGAVGGVQGPLGAVAPVLGLGLGLQAVGGQQHQQQVGRVGAVAPPPRHPALDEAVVDTCSEGGVSESHTLDLSLCVCRCVCHGEGPNMLPGTECNGG